MVQDVEKDCLDQKAMVLEKNKVRNVTMKSLNLKKSALLLGVLSSVFFLTAESKAYERYTWSELVTGARNGSSATEDKMAVVCEWCGLKRIVKSQISDLAKMKKAYSVIQNKNKYSTDDYFKAVMDLRYTYKYSFKDLKKADEVLSYLDAVPELKNKAELERLLSGMTEHTVLEDDFYSKLYNLRNVKNLFPYDNGYMPVITNNRALFMLSVKEMVDGKGKLSEGIKIKSWKDIPSDILYLIATDKRENAYQTYTHIKAELNPQACKLIEDFLYPLYMPVKPANRKFLAGVYCVELFPNLGIDLINESLTSDPRVLKPEHALACLSDVYIRHNAHNEAQKVLKLLSDYYPDSIWLK